MSREKMPLPCAAAPQGLLDWTPKHISLLFNPLDFKASSGDFTTETTGESARPKLLPSPCFVQSTPLLASHEPIVRPKQPTASQTSALLHKKLPPSPIQESPSPCIRPPTDPSPSSDSDDDHSNLMIHRSISLADITSSSPDTVLTTPTATPTVDAYNKFKGRQTVRETWGSRLDDPRLGRNNEDIVPLNLRRPVSTSTLSTLTPSTSKDSVLKEPTFDDFYALSDDDIAESPLSTPGSCAPPTPPPKNTPDYHRKNSLPRVITSAHITFTPGQQEITPPDTPIDCDLLALTYSPTSPRNPFGALWAAELAKKYDFAVVYVMSLWPVGGGRSSNTLDNTLASEPRPNNMVAMGMAGASGNGSRISGRLLAAYGLNEVPSPFEIITETHLSALSCDYWNEYRNVDACPNDIARGWIRPFYSDYIPLSASSDATRNPRTCHPKNRGIIFAAYSKQTNNPIIPMRTSPEQDFRLGQLYLDAKTFVEALITQPYGLNKAPVFYPGLRNVNANIK
ncbi:hypothetical protein SAMD00023353_0202510 [Rosellinia necatrix]|uniref:Uncharacterized protein n=1 Tax=Rosellinia necatrix TaxID=77044 RepID=A0A1S7UK39_ROSNE|nr:hypothetical protein SAMD00023353_0202510 [Rosellinia necatrix]